MTFVCAVPGLLHRARIWTRKSEDGTNPHLMHNTTIPSYTQLEKPIPRSHTTHLLLTLFMQVFYPGKESPVFYVANRGHHADIGGKTPGKLPILYLAYA